MARVLVSNPNSYAEYDGWPNEIQIRIPYEREKECVQTSYANQIEFDREAERERTPANSITRAVCTNIAVVQSAHSSSFCNGAAIVMSELLIYAVCIHSNRQPEVNE